MPGNATNVRMLAETVLMDVNPYNSNLDGYMQVTATFTMTNLGDAEEQMLVRFPLDYRLGRDTLDCSYDPQWDIGSHVMVNMVVWVNGVETPHDTIYQDTTVMDAYGNPVVFHVPCWANFPVTFPVGKNVIIEVTYSTDQSEYVLFTGAGWNGTIGTADIIVRVPYDINPYNFSSCFPDSCTLSQREIRWHFEDFEPDFYITFDIMAPKLWHTIQVERANVAINPNDGEAWGRLAKAYKEAIRSRLGSHSDPAWNEMFRWSVEAYQKAVTLLPDDADWHYGFADLLCVDAMWSYDYFNWQAWHDCVSQLKQTLDINPRHENALYLLGEVADFPTRPNVVDIHNGTPVYLILLTPQPTATAPTTPTLRLTPTNTATNTLRPTSTPRPTATAIRPTPTRQATPTPTKSAAPPIPTLSPTPTIQATATIPVTPDVLPLTATVPDVKAVSSSSGYPIWVFFILGAILLAGIVVYVLIRKK